MPITSSQLKFYRALINADGASNGGTLTSVLLIDNAKNNLFPDVPQSERAAGSTKYRKAFVKVDSTDNSALLDPKVFIETPSPGNDVVSIFLATETDTEALITGSERLYGAGFLTANVSAGATSFSVQTEGAAYQHFQSGDSIRLSDKTSVVDSTHAEEYLTIATNGVTWNGSIATITVTMPILNAYASPATTKVSSCLTTSQVLATVDSITKVAAAGNFDVAYKPSVVNISVITQTWTLTFTSATAFTCAGSTLGMLSGAGLISGTYAPANPSFSGYSYFSIPANFFTGTLAAGDTITFKTHPAIFPIWYKRVVPVNCVSLAGNKVIVGIDGEST